MQNPAESNNLKWNETLLWSAAAVLSFHLAYSSSIFSFAILLFLFCLFQLRKLDTNRKAFYVGLAIGLFIYGPQLRFFYGIFGFGAVALWLVLAFWIGLFLVLARSCSKRFSTKFALLLLPFLWTGLEYFRSELYYLRFSWLSVGFAFQAHLSSTLGALGVYGIGFACAAFVSIIELMRATTKLGALGLVSLPLVLLGNAPVDVPLYKASDGSVQIAGVQLEFPMEEEVLGALDKLVETHPAAKLLVLSEYTFTEALPNSIKEWCKRNERYLIVGAQDPTADGTFYNTAFVVGPEGEIVFRQAKSVPIQFFKDGLPAPRQQLWNSPWGKIGIAICYDLSYRNVIDELARLGAQALIIPTMDVAEWGEYQHRLHSRVAPLRAAEYGIPIYRLCSSGISQFVDERGYVRASASFPGEREMISGPLTLNRPARLPLDRWLAPFCILVLAGVTLWISASRFLMNRKTA